MKDFSMESKSLAVRVAGIVLCAALLSSSSIAQKASFGQQVAVMKALKGDLKVIGVISTAMTDKLTQDLTRAGVSQGVTIVIAKAKDAREEAGINFVMQ